MGLRARWTTAVAAAVVAGVMAGMVGAAPAHAGPTNSAPVAVADTATAFIGTEARINPVANDTDPDPGAVLVLAGVPTVTSGSATVTVAGSEVVIIPLLGTTSPVILTYLVTDGVDTSLGTITVDVPNRAPTAAPDVAQVASGGQVQVDPRGNDADPDGEGLIVTSAVVSSGAGSVTTDGQTLLITPAAGFVGPLVVTYVVSDPRGGQATSTVTVVVRSTNRPPVAVADAVSVTVGRTYRIPVLANDTDPDGDRVTLVKVGKAKHGRAKKSGSKVVYTAPKSWTGTVKVTYTIKDVHGARDKAVLRIVVKKRAPKVTPTPSPAPAGKRAVEAALLRLGMPTGSVNGHYDASTRRAVCAWRTVTGRQAHRGLPTAREARSIVAMAELPRARASMVSGVNVSVTCQAAFWVGADREYRRVMAASTGKAGYRTRLGVHRVFRTHDVWRTSTIYPEARMYKPMQFSGGQAMHGSATDSLVKTYPASHGCVRMLHRDIDAMQAGGVGNGTS
jgi:hypothetical protein